jgi:hypothetical protein
VLAGHVFSLASPNDIRQVLFDELHLDQGLILALYVLHVCMNCMYLFFVCILRIVCMVCIMCFVNLIYS